MLNKLIGERDWSAQEVSHLLLQLPVQNSSRGVVSLDCRPEEVQDDLIVLESGDISVKRSVLQRYRDRLPIPPPILESRPACGLPAGRSMEADTGLLYCFGWG